MVRGCFIIGSSEFKRMLNGWFFGGGYARNIINYMESKILKENPDTCVRIPMIGETRSLNLSNSVAIVLYEALRQNHFDHMKLEGQLHRLSWDE